MISSQSASALKHETATDAAEVKTQATFWWTALPTLLQRPLYMADSDWLEHIPFAFWLIEAHRPNTLVELGMPDGVSYFAFCQEVARVGIRTRCYKIHDTAETVDALTAHNATHYSAFSTLLTGQTARPPLPLTSARIDLLHLDSTGSYDTLRATLNAWLPVMSDRAILLLHRTTPWSRESGAAQLLAELSAAHPVFEMMHGAGLAMVALGETQNETVSNLLATADDPATREVAQDMFSRLGAEFRDAYTAGAAQQIAFAGTGPRAAESALRPTADETSSGDLRAVQEALKAAHKSLEARYDEIATLTRMIQPMEAARQLAEEDVVELRKQFEDYQERLSATEARALRAEQMARDRAKQARKDLAHLQGSLAERDRNLATTRFQMKTLQSQAKRAKDNVAALQERLADRDQKLATVRSQSKEVQAQSRRAKDNAAILRKRLAEREQTLAKLHAKLSEQTALRREWERMYHAVTHSRSWRITAPLRSGIRAFRGKRKG